MEKKPRKEHTSERDLIKYCYYGLCTAIGAYLRARREEFNKRWVDLENSTGVDHILDIERGKKFPTEKSKLEKIFKELSIENVENLSDLMISLEKFRVVMKEKRFKL